MLPRHIDYPRMRPQGFPASSKIYKFNPQGFLPGNIGFNDIIRFIIQSDGYWDPYSAYINLTVDVSDNPSIRNDTTGNVLQLDGSGHSFFNSLIVYNKGTEIERIMEYDTLGSILTDMNYDQQARRTRCHEGAGGIDSGNIAGPLLSSFPVMKGMNSTTVSAGELGGYHPRLNNSEFKVGVVGPSGGTFRAVARNGKSTWDLLELEYNYGYQGLTAPANSSGLSFTNFPMNLTAAVNENPTNDGVGFVEPFNSQTACSANEIKFSNAIGQNVIVNGAPTRAVITSHTFTIPLLSGILGMLMPFEDYKLIPMKALQELILEFKMNPFAFFTNNNNVSRTYKITRFELCTELVYFNDTVDKAVQSQLEGEGVIFHSNSFYLGPIYNLFQNQIPGSIQINLGFESLKDIYFIFLSSDYQQYSNCRKQFRLSHNVTSFQLKVGTNFYPMQPIIGNGGTVLGPNNNSEFFVHLQKSFNRLHDLSKPQLVNAVNFAINDRDFKPFTQSGVTVTQTPNLQDYSFFCENRAIGKAIYGMDLEPLNYDTTILSGINTIVQKPFEILLTYEATGSYPRASQMMIFCYYDFIINVSSTSTKVIGRG